MLGPRLCRLFVLLTAVGLETTRAKFIQLDHSLIPRNASNLYGLETLDNKDLRCTKEGGYAVKQGTTDRFLQDLHSKYDYVLGTNKSVYFDEDWGMFSAVLASYNNHWVLRTTPDDWWTVAVRRIAQALDEHGEKERVREFFVEHRGQKTIDVNVGPTLSNIDYRWLFEQFSSKVKENINKPDFVDIIESDFTGTTQEQKIITQVMLMASVKKYFAFEIYTLCGIPGLELLGRLDDWAQLVHKLDRLSDLLSPITKELGLEQWFPTARRVFSNLLDTYGGKPNTAWWGKILSWRHGGSGTRAHWSGWFPYFLGANAPPPSADGGESVYYSSKEPADPADFPSGLVEVPLKITDGNGSPPVKGDGLLVAGTLGFTVDRVGKYPAVQPTQVWSLLLPKSTTGQELKRRLLG